MKNLIVIIGVLAVVAAIPVPETKPESSIDLLQIPFGNNKVSEEPTLEHSSLPASNINSTTCFNCCGA